MKFLRRFAVATISLCAFFTMAGCRNEPAAALPAKAATVAAPVKEATLTTITLSAEAEKRLAVVTVPVERKTIATTRTVGAEIAAPSGSTLAITAPVAGTLQSPPGVPVAGSAVSRGQPLFRLVPIQPSERDAATDAEQAAANAAARLEVTRLRVRRAEQLVEDGAGSRRALEEAQAELALAEAEAKAASARVASATRSGTSPAGVTIDSPQDAIVQAVHVRDGQTVAAAAPMIDLVRLTTVWVRVPMYAGESSSIDPAAPARVLALGEPSDADGILARPIAAPPSANASTAGVDLYFSLANPNQRFRPGERVAVRLTGRSSREGLVVPKAALLHDAYGGTWVYVARGPHVYARERVTVSTIVDSLALVSQGPAPGARVVTDGAAELFGVEFGAGK
jgi:cobalt-zinc-cadmium efflux system membrane fusion protein